MFYNILDEKRKDILPFLEDFKKEFYLAGGTALALQLGHRDSVDFDFFSEQDFSTVDLFEKTKRIFKNKNIQKIQDEKNTLTIILDENLKISFFSYKYKLIKPLLSEKYIRIASVEDIACMKLSAIVSRSTEKDYIDLYFILQRYSLSELLDFSKQKFPELDTNLILKSLIYFDDIGKEPISFKNNQEVSFEDVRGFLREKVKGVFYNTY